MEFLKIMMISFQKKFFAKRKFSYFVNRKDDKPAKIWHFQCSELIFEAKNQLIFAEKGFLL